MARMTIELPSEIVETVAQTAETLCVSKVEVLRRMFAILKITQEEKKKGNDLGIVNGDKVVARFLGV
jgi:predicted transcriptional regulator